LRIGYIIVLKVDELVPLCPNSGANIQWFSLTSQLAFTDLYNNQRFCSILTSMVLCAALEELVWRGLYRLA
jgi:hypothetical protein